MWFLKRKLPDDEYAKVNLGKDSSGRPLILDARTYAMVLLARKRFGFDFTIVQGSYCVNGAAASAGTHDGGGCIDIRVWDLPAGKSITGLVTVLRRTGFWAWSRTTAQGFDPHIHCCDAGNERLAWLAAAQVKAAESPRGSNGLGDLSTPDDGPKVPVPHFVYEPQKVSVGRVQAASSGRLKGAVPSVRTVQRVLTARGYPCAVDGLWGPQTTLSFARFCRKRGLTFVGGAPSRKALRRLGSGRRFSVVK